jgi:hypothetical protein
MIIKSISTLMYTVWHVDKYKIVFKLVINPQNISTIKYLFMKNA